jgi:hypothetical protein
MPDQPAADERRVLTADQIASEVLATLLERQQALVPIEELVRELDVPGLDLPATFIEEAATSLVQAGLAHRLERFYFASHAAVRGQALRQ